jgi:hypothetical protein
MDTGQGTGDSECAGKVWSAAAPLLRSSLCVLTNWRLGFSLEDQR